MLPDWWPWAAGGLAGLLALLGIGALLHRRKPKLARIAPFAPISNAAQDTSPAELPRLDLQLDIISANRSMMMFTIEYRLELANRTDRAVRDLSIATGIACARRGVTNTASPGAAREVQSLDRIGPQQSRSITGQLRLPLSEITPLRQGGKPLFIPLLHLTLEGQGQGATTRTFVIGIPSEANPARVQPIMLDTLPGSIPGLRAQPVDVPNTSAAA